MAEKGSFSPWAKPYMRQLLAEKKDPRLFELLVRHHIVFPEENEVLQEEKIDYRIRTYIQFVELALPCYVSEGISLEYLTDMWRLLENQRPRKAATAVLLEELKNCLLKNPHFTTEYDFILALFKERLDKGLVVVSQVARRREQLICQILDDLYNENKRRIDHHFTRHPMLLSAFLNVQGVADVNLLVLSAKIRKKR